MKDKYIKGSHISEKKFREIIKYFCMDFTASDVAKLSCISRVTINKIFNGIREEIFHQSYISQGKHSGEFELDESYFGAKRI